MSDAHPTRLDPPVDPSRDHVLGSDTADLTLVEYGSYACPYCHAAHEIVTRLRDRYGERLRYVFRHRPITGSEDALCAAQLVELGAAARGEFWEIHDGVMKRGTAFRARDTKAVAAEHGIPLPDPADAAARAAALERVEEDVRSAQRCGVLVSPTFFVNNRRYEGAWDESSLSEALLGSLGHRLHTATVDFVHWAPSTGLLLLLMTLVAIALANSPFGPAFEAWWRAPLAISLGEARYEMSLLAWINDGLLSIFFLVVGLEIKREFTVGRLATLRAAALPIAGSIGGMLVPASLYLEIVPAGTLAAGWGTTISTDTAFAVALIVLLGSRVPVELRVFLTAAVIVDDLVAIAVVALFYGTGLSTGYLMAALAITASLIALNHAGVYRPLPYAVLGVALWVCVHHAGVHATLAGVVLALVTPTRPPANLAALQAQAEMIIRAETRRADVMRHGPSEPALRALDVVHDRIESPASKLLRTVEPWSSYVVLPLFALANAGVAWSSDIFRHGMLMLAIVAGLVAGKPVGIVITSWLAVRLGIAEKPDAYSWRQLLGAGTLAGIGFTMSLFIAGQAFEEAAEFAAAKVAIFIASLAAGALGVALLWRSPAKAA